jgi:peroxiredoxin
MTNMARFFRVIILAAFALASPLNLVGDEPTKTATAEGATPGETELFALGKRLEELDPAHREAMKAAKTVEDRVEISDRLRPINILLEDFFQLESKYRGSDDGMAALFPILSGGAQTLSESSPVATGRRRALKLLTEHYASNPNLYLMFTMLESGTLSPEASDLLRVAAKSPHRRVQGSARLKLATINWQRITQREDLQTILDLEAKATKPIEPKQRELMSARLRALEALDLSALRSEALAQLEIVSRDFADVPSLRLSFDGPGRVKIRSIPNDPLAERMGSYGARADQLRFEIEHLSIGSAAPQFQAKDTDGTDISLANLRGRVVVLMFSADWCSPCKEMYPANRELVKKYADRPFTLLSIMADDKPDTVHAARTGGSITWPAHWDGQNGEIAKHWNVSQWPTIYVIDAAGVIRYRELSDESLELAVGKLLGEIK